MIEMSSIVVIGVPGVTSVPGLTRLKPSTPAMMETTKNISAHFNIAVAPF